MPSMMAVREPRTLYCGFDPTADSLHIGSLVPLLVLRRFQAAGHRPIALVGGATGLIGDPSFKAAERQLNTPEVVADWVAKIREQVSQFIDFTGDDPALVVNNLDWMAQSMCSTFCATSEALFGQQYDRQRIRSAAARPRRRRHQLYRIQLHDSAVLRFAELYHRHGCGLQIGGSDQWGNITGGIDLTRRLHGGQVFGLTLPP
ncbi:MAG: hypothetical protein CM15mP89_3700 [Gammaproteobacteria bacterium]|nr:MAG: hypothetical protein CM15mP89_3700 [Gammaproteobacteria bacterium]